MYLNTFLNTFLHTPLNINNRSSVDWSANHGFKHFNAVTCCICLLLNNTVLYPLLCYISQLKKVHLKHLIIKIYIVHLYFVQYNATLSFLALFCLRTKRVATCILVRYVPHPIRIQFVFHLSILKLDLNVKHWYKNIYSIYFIVRPVCYNFSRNITISEKLQVWNLLPAGNVCKLHVCKLHAYQLYYWHTV